MFEVTKAWDVRGADKIGETYQATGLVLPRASTMFISLGVQGQGTLIDTAL